MRQILDFDKLNRKAFKIISNDKGFLLITPYNKCLWDKNADEKGELFYKINNILNNEDYITHTNYLKILEISKRI